MALLPTFPDAAQRRERLRQARERLDASFRVPHQVLGKRFPMGCVALEITQRCNLDCTLCYLSENSERTKDVPLEAVMRRLEQIRETYGCGMAVQITGGDPTLRKRPELVAIVRRATELGLEPALFTNGILAHRDLLQELAAAGLCDVAFHVDMTQERKGFASEESLNAVRQEYIERARGLGLAVIFNTTVHDGNFHELPALVRFFKKNADVVGMASFQMQAVTGRGELTDRTDTITVKNVRRKISEGAGIDIRWDNVMVGHPECNSVAFTVVTGGSSVNIHETPDFFAMVLKELEDVYLPRANPVKTGLRTAAGVLLTRPRLAAAGLVHVAKILGRNFGTFLRGGFVVRKQTYFIHNFMDAEHLVGERCTNCVFRVATGEHGFVSMCVHNAQRDRFILTPVPVSTPHGMRRFDPLSGELLPLAAPAPAAAAP